jgi:hypothetical protein
MTVRYDRQTLIEGNKLRAQAAERPATFAEYNGAVNVQPADTTRMAGSGGVRAIELMTNPAAAKQTEAWMSQFGQSVPGYEFNQAKMIEAQPAQPAAESEEKS